MSAIYFAILDVVSNEPLALYHSSYDAHRDLIEAGYDDDERYMIDVVEEDAIAGYRLEALKPKPFGFHGEYHLYRVRRFLPNKLLGRFETHNDAAGFAHNVLGFNTSAKFTITRHLTS